MFREAIRDELNRRGWRVADLARAVGWPHQNISRYLCGDRDMTGRGLTQLLNALGLRIVDETVRTPEKSDPHMASDALQHGARDNPTF